MFGEGGVLKKKHYFKEEARKVKVDEEFFFQEHQ